MAKTTSDLAGMLAAAALLLLNPAHGFVFNAQPTISMQVDEMKAGFTRKSFNSQLLSATFVGTTLYATEAQARVTQTQVPEPADAKSRARYPDFTLTDSGLQYKDVRVGTEGPSPEDGDRVVIDWEGYTIGYFGRPFEMKNSVKGGAFEGDKDYFRFVLGQGKAIPAIEEGVRGMKRGGLRQLIIPREIGYPASDPKHNVVGPKPSTFSGERALNFVLENEAGTIDKTILINIELKRVDKPGERGFKGL
mmetsp:Transcript_12851/g.18965  ORF Transcript_12851/g.18965 Transcript_12851/m.18965 type:complete len:249 (-) Transcript_12851:167-913(-)